MEYNFGWWFTFEPPANLKIQNIIQQISTDYGDGQIYLPHLSFYAYTQQTLAQAQNTAKTLQQLLKPFSTKTIKINYEQAVHKTLFIECEVTPEMTQAVNFMEKTFKKDFTFKPHISLIYKADLPNTIRAELSQTIQFPQEIQINGIAYYIAPEQKLSAEFFREWEAPIVIEFD